MSAAREPGNVTARWFPVARSEEVISRHVVQTQLLGQEFAVWRDDAGSVNAWENRCPHRGVRLSIGFNTGTELRCQYHGWRYATGSGQCTFIPAHPGQKPSSAIRANVYRSIEHHGFVWVHVGPQTHAAALPTLGPLQGTTLRSMFVEASTSTVAETLLRDASMVAHDAFILTTTAGSKGPDVTAQDAAVTFLLQPMTESQTVIHGLLHAQSSGAERLTVLRHQNSRMTALRDAAEDAIRAHPHKSAAVERL
jgi:nitrite reductase/ring-hydroxylating ferredoxin subunit